MAICPKYNGCAVTVSEYNCVNSHSEHSQQAMENELENSINISKLQFCCNLQDIPHDYLVVDAFTDSSGWNDTVQSCCTTSTYCSSGLTGFYCGCNKKLTTVPIVWSCPVKMVYYTDEKSGSGTRVYNVINASTGLCVACNIPANCMCVLSCCVCCHKYEIIQCNDAVSCIKSYAIVVGV
jgi:hypothetical protein